MNIETLRLQTARPDALYEFYAEEFGVDVSSRADGRVAIEFGETTVDFEPAPRETNPAYHFALDVPANRFDDAVAWLADRTPLLEDAGTGSETFFFEFMNAHAAYCLDPAGNIVELVARHGLPNGSTDAFHADSLRRVSEIGLPTPDVPGTVDALETIIDARRWPESSDEFAVVGDDEGMFIVVETGRHWYPTETPASDAFPITIRTPDAVDVCAFETLPYRVEPT